MAKILSYWGKNRHCSRVRVKFVFADWRFFCVLRELIFVIRTNWFFSLGINICDFQKETGNPALTIFSYLLSTCKRNEPEIDRISFCF